MRLLLSDSKHFHTDVSIAYRSLTCQILCLEGHPEPDQPSEPMLIHSITSHSLLLNTQRLGPDRAKQLSKVRS